jgi:signal peptidase I
MSNFSKLMKEWIIPFAIVILISLAIRTYGFAHIQVFNVSMQSTLFEGHRLIENKITYRFSEPKRGDIVVTHGPEYPERLIKRVIGLPGETIDFADGHVVIDGKVLEEDYTQGSSNRRSMEMPLTIPEDTYFLMGDNREHSVDSRDLGTIPSSSIEGKASFRFWPFSLMGTLD